MSFKNWLKCSASASLALSLFLLFSGPSDSYIKDRVVKLQNKRGSCSGEQIQAPSGTSYILTAGHCANLAENGSIEVVTESGLPLQRRIVAEDKKSDLLLLEGVPALSGLKVAWFTLRDQPVRTFTHGLGLDSYRTEGVLISDQEIPVNIGVPAPECPQMEKYKIIATLFGDICALDVIETATTALIVPGSSGGAVVDSSGAIVGVVSAGGEGMGWLVPLRYIHDFIKGY